MKMEPTVSSETSAIRTQTPGNYPKRNKLHLEHGESLNTGMKINQPFLQILETWPNKRNKKKRYKFPDLGKHNKKKIYGRVHL